MNRFRCYGVKSRKVSIPVTRSEFIVRADSMKRCATYTFSASSLAVARR